VDRLKDSKQTEHQEEEESFGHWLMQTIGLTVVFVGIVVLLFTFVLANDQVSGPSMQPTFESNDRIIALRHDKIDRGDIVILKAPDEPGALYIKRVIGMPGDTLQSKNDVMYINGKKYAQPFLKEYESELPSGTLYTEDFTLQSLGMGSKVPKDSYFVMGDHRNVSKDSRRIGYIKKSAIVGVVKLRYWPLNQMKVF
jgi:signal peptidase I